MEEKTVRNKCGKTIAISVIICLLIIFALLCKNVQSGSANNQGETGPAEISESVVPSTVQTKETTSSREIVGYTPDDEPIYEDETWIPEPSYFDEYGVKYILRDGTFAEYYIDEDYQEEIKTPESSAFTKIMYFPYYGTLSVQFRNSGVWYDYYDVPPEIWGEFKNAESKGSYFNECIKGQYEYDHD